MPTNFLHAMKSVTLFLLLALPFRAAGGQDVASFDVSVSQEQDAPVVRGLMQTGPGKPYGAPVLAADLGRLRVLGYQARKLRVEFRDDGAAVSLSAVRVDKPAPPQVRAVEFDGGVPEVNAGCRAMLSQRASTLFRPRPLDYFGLLGDAGRIERAYRARGWLDAAVTGVAFAVADDAAADVLFSVAPGSQYRVARAAVSGAKSVDADELARELEFARTRPWTEELRLQLADRAVRFCRERGYLDARAEVVPEKQPGGAVNLLVTLTEGGPYVLNNAVVRGAGELKDEVADLVTLRRDEPVRQSEVDALADAIDALGAFSDAEMLFVPVRDAPGRRDLVIRLTPLDLGREIGDAEKLYYEMMKQIIRLYNRGEDGLRSLRAGGFFTLDGRRIEIDASFVRPGYAHVTIALPADGRAEPQSIDLLRSGGVTRLAIPRLNRVLRIPVGSLALRLVVVPPDRADGRPTEFHLSPGLVNLPGGDDVILFGERCPPVAAYFTEQAERFRRTPPTLDEDGALLLPGAADGETMRIVLDGDQLPRGAALLDKDGNETARLDIGINQPVEQVEPGDAAEGPAGAALTAPLLWSLGLSDVAAALADKAVADSPNSPECLAARGLIRLAAGPPEPGLADLRAAADASNHPAYPLLLAETLMRAGRFGEAKAVCEKAAKDAAPPPKEPDPADVLLGAGLSMRSAFDALTAPPADYARRARTDLALALIGLGEYAPAAELARSALADSPGDAQATELLVRCELGLGNGSAALDIIEAFEPDRRNAQVETYTALAQEALGDEDDAAAALGRAMTKAPALRNLFFLQERAADIHPRYKTPAARAALAKVFSRAVTGDLGAEQKAQLAAVVNDAYVLRSDLDALTARLAAGEFEDVPPAKLRAAALNRIIEDMLIIRRAMWRGLSVSDDEVYGAMRDEMTRLGAVDFAHYRKLLEEHGSDVADRPGEIRDTLLRSRAFALVVADKVFVRPEEVRAAYDEKHEQFTAPETARLRMITLEFGRFRGKDDAEKLARTLLARVKENPDRFADLAREYSQDANAARGGLWEDVTRASLVDPLDKAVFESKPGEITGVVRSDLGCHVILVEKIEPAHAVPLAEAAPEIVRSLHETRARAEISAWIERLKAESYIEVFDPELTSGR